MKGPRETLSPEVRSLLDEEREIPAQPAAVRARAIARARAAIEAGIAAPPFAAGSSRVAPTMRWAAAVALAFAATAAVGAVTYGVSGHFARDQIPMAAHPTHPAPAVAAPKAPAPPPAAIPAPIAVPIVPIAVPIAVPIVPIDEAPPARARVISPPRLSRADAVRAELTLLRPARAAVAREDFAAALPPIAEHARRFKDGRLTEEREALRVKALVGLGRSDEARRAAAAFRAHFPHSVLLPAVGQMSATGG
jgi:hypothetical protein